MPDAKMDAGGVCSAQVCSGGFLKNVVVISLRDDGVIGIIDRWWL
jgi:hypothetical protein